MNQNFFRNPMRVRARTAETPDTWTLVLEPADGRPYHWRPGQFACFKIGDTGESRCYTLSSTDGVNDGPAVTVMRKPGGTGSGWMTETVRPGDILAVSDAMGEFTCDESTAKKYLFMATGSGITPVLSMTRWLLVNRPGCDIKVIYTVRSPQHIVARDLWRALAAYRPDELTFLPFAKENPDEDCLTGRLTCERLAELVPDAAEREAYVCASPGFVAASREWCLSLGMPAGHYHTEAFGPAAQ